MEKKIKLKCAIIGSSKIAKIHARELLNNKISDIYFVSRNLKKSKLFSEEFNKQYDSKSKYANHNIFNKKKFDIIDICSNTKFHEKQILKFSNLKSKILVEKPIISIQKNQNSIGVLNKIYKNNSHIFVSYPMFYFARSFVKKFKYNKKNLNKIEIYYQTKGKHKSRDIFLDLAPHAFAFIISISNITNIKNLSLHNMKLLSKKVLCSGKINNIMFRIIFIEDNKKKQSVFKFKINNTKVNRITKNENNNFMNYLKLNNKILSTKNPMSEVINDFLKNKKIINFEKNKKLTFMITDITKKIYDKSFSTTKSTS